MAATPWLMRKDECFAVTVPEGARRDPRLVAFRRRYAAVVAAVTAASVAGFCAALAVFPGVFGSELGLVALVTLPTFAPVAVSFALMLHFRRRVQAVKRAEGWSAPRAQAVAVVAEDDLPRALPLAWNLLYVPVVLGTVALGVALWPSIPDMVPMHADFAGNVNRWEPKSVGSVFFPVLVQLFMIACLVFCHWSILRSKRPASPGAPVTSALAYGLFARAESVLLLVSGLIITVALGVSFMLSAVGAITLGGAAVVIVVAVAPILVGSVAISVVYGQAGSRLFRRMEDAGAAGPGAVMPADDDAHWKLGIFYVNRDDASLFVPERFGIGWTLNLGRPGAWAVIAGFVAVTALFLVLVFVAVG
nr:DUF1648 domain-containing protein [Adlercreutzia sp. JBNU-10]